MLSLNVVVFVILSLSLYVNVAFSFSGRISSVVRLSEKLKMCEVNNAPEVAENVVIEEEDDNGAIPFFGSNKNVRLGRSRDQDGKSNIWSIEPKMTVQDDVEEGSGTKTNLLVFGLTIGAALASLPLFLGFSKLFPDPADF